MVSASPEALVTPEAVTDCDSVASNAAVRAQSLLMLVHEHDVSVRLRNSIRGAATAGTLPFETVGDYADAGSQALPILLHKVRSFGRKTARELDALVRAMFVAGTGSVPVPPVADCGIEREALLGLFGDETVASIAADELFSARLTNVLTQGDFASLRFADFIDHFQASIAAMLRVPNCGRKSADEFRRFCQRFIGTRLLEAGYGDPAPLVAWLLGGPAPSNVIAFTSDALDSPEAVAFADPLAAPDHTSLAERLDWLLAELDPRAHQIVRRRNGIGQAERETLEEIGDDYDVTRERIRQVEAKALRRIRFRVRRAPIARLLLAEVPAVWHSLSQGAAFLRRCDFHEARRALDPYIRLALDIEELAIERWLDQIAVPMPHGWLAPGMQVEAVEAAGVTLLADTAPLPQAFGALVDSDTIPAAELAAILILGRPACHGYLMPPRVGSRLTRVVRLHALLAAHGAFLALERLVQRYRASFDDDPCSERDAEIVMDAAPHLFLEIEEGCWSAVGIAGAELCFLTRAEVPIAPRPEDPGTIAYALQSTLQQRGPTRLVDLLDDAAQILPDGRSINSIGPVLLTRRELFVRALPGVYALPEHIAVYARTVPENWSVLFNDSQARLYAIARYAGEPHSIFPLWSPRLEYDLCRWARHSGGAGIFESLLAIASVEDWPCEAEVRDEWRRLQLRQGRYGLGVSLRHNAAYELPPLDRVFAACRYAAACGQFNWVAGNRLTGRKIDSHGGAGLVALLLRLGVLEQPATHGYRWQRPHRTLPHAAGLVARLEAAFGGLGAGADWTSALGRALADEAVHASAEDWVDDAALAAMLSRSSAPPSLTADDDDDPLEALLAAQRRARDADRRDATLDWLLDQ